MSWENEKRICPHCGIEFMPNAHNQKYHSEECKQAAENKRWYQQNKEARKKQITEQRRQKREERRKLLVDRMALAGTTYLNEQIALGNPQIDLTNAWRKFLPEGTPQADEKAAMLAFVRGTELAAEMHRVNALMRGHPLDDSPLPDEA